jgi:6-pyruvoyl-tetrahydropterin synthase
MYAVTVRDRMMIAHSFQGEAFGPAQRLHGATYVVDVTLWRPDLNADGVAVDIAAAGELLSSVVGELTFRNLDDVPAFAGRNTTTEVLAKAVFDRLAARIREGALGGDGHALTALRVTLNESDIASASYEAALTAGA